MILGELRGEREGAASGSGVGEPAVSRAVMVSLLGQGGARGTERGVTE